VQALLFVIVSLIATAGLRPALRRHFGRDADEPTPVAEITGTDAVVLERVDSERGMIKIDGEYWQARALDAGQVMEPGERVHVVEVKGVTAMVWKD
jgi:membrane protein implicated in regulation of membrane protease activity